MPGHANRERLGCPEKDSCEQGLENPEEQKDFLVLSWGLAGLLGQKDGLDVGQDTSLCDGDTGQKFVQFLVVADSQLKVTGDDSRLLVVTGGVACQFEYLSSQVFQNGCQVDWGSGSNALGVVAFPQEPVDSSHGELETSTRRAGLGFALNFSSFAAARHDE